jgi:UDP-N-acetylmuramoyl-L-alanyl-D-glutamate--2,6-diaminopimelate ligase
MPPTVAPRRGLTLEAIAALLERVHLLVERPHDLPELWVERAVQDSREVRPGDLFLCWAGTLRDGHDFLPEVEAGGAVAALVERAGIEGAIPKLVVRDGRRAAAIVAMALEGNPDQGMFISAITGTNGKTTTALLVRHLVGGAWTSVALGTLGVVGAEGEIPEISGGLTTPGPVEAARTFSALRDRGVQAVSLEASSHALDQRRLDGLHVDVACFTNLTRDHLDYHGTMEAYLEAKARLLDLLTPEGTVILNGNEPAWAALPPIPGRLKIVRQGEEEPPISPPLCKERLPDLTAQGVVLGRGGSRFLLTEAGASHPVHLPLLGRFNVDNALCAAGVARAAGLPLGEIAQRLSSVLPPRGRLELLQKDPFSIILDFAHTPDALQRVLETLKPLYPGRLIVVFGAGGDRDRAKRPEMGRVVSDLADLALVTSDNPRTEDPERIVDDILVGMRREGWERIVNRRQAIARAIEVARAGDAILLAGKGHETYQIVGTEKQPFDEREIVARILFQREMEG